VTTAALPYQIVSTVHLASFDRVLNETVEGTQVKALWLATRDAVTVFVPDSVDFVAGARTLILARGAELDKLYGIAS
jgi:hypothetical protein